MNTEYFTVQAEASVAPSGSIEMDAASLSITMTYCLELPRPAAVCSSWSHAVRCAMGQIWETFWLGKFDTLHFERGLGISSPWWKWYVQALPDGMVPWWERLQFILFTRIQSYYDSALDVALDQCMVRNMDYNFMRRFLPLCVENLSMKANFQPQQPYLCDIRNMRCKHLGVTVLEVVDSISLTAKQRTKRRCRCPKECAYARSRAVVKEWLRRQLHDLEMLASNVKQ